MPPQALANIFFFFNDTATTEIYTLSLHDALPISAPGTSPPHCPLELESPVVQALLSSHGAVLFVCTQPEPALQEDRKSTRLNSSHDQISYAVFCLKKKHIRYI